MECGGGLSYALEGTSLGDNVYGAQGLTWAQTAGYTSNTASGVTDTDNNATISTDMSNGTVSFTGHAYSLTTAPVSGAYTHMRYLPAGVSTMPNGASINQDTTIGVTTATSVINGIQWTVRGVADTDGANIDFAVTNSAGGSYSFKQALALFVQPGTTISDALRAPSAVRNTKGGAARTAVVAGGVAAVMGGIAAVAAVIPGGQVVAATAGICAAAALLVSAGAAIIDYNETHRPS